jgi:hypothetical protein
LKIVAFPADGQPVLMGLAVWGYVPVPTRE